MNCELYWFISDTWNQFGGLWVSTESRRLFVVLQGLIIVSAIFTLIFILIGISLDKWIESTEKRFPLSE